MHILVIGNLGDGGGRSRRRGNWLNRFELGVAEPKRSNGNAGLGDENEDVRRARSWLSLVTFSAAAQWPGQAPGLGPMGLLRPGARRARITVSLSDGKDCRQYRRSFLSGS